MFSVYLQVSRRAEHQKCFHTFKTQREADRYAKRGAEICKFITIVIDPTGKQVSKYDFRPN